MIKILHVIAMFASSSVLQAPDGVEKERHSFLAFIVPYFCLSCRYTEKEKTAAGKPTVTGPGPAPPPSAQRELSNGTDETLRRWSALCLGSS